jgi:hypothetical protein
MKRKWWVVAIILAAIGVLWIMASDEAYLAPLQTAIGLKPASVERSKSKPVCDSPVNPNVAAPTDCIPQHLANLPPDPGEAGKLTIDGIDADRDGIRDDIQRYIWDEYPDSERARAALFTVAKVTQMRVHYGDSLGKEETRKRMADIMRASICYMGLATEGMLERSASERLRNKVTNTPERWKQSREFDYMLAHNVYDLPDLTVAEACGFDPEKLPN